ncbi:PREDICTED: uridine diphosphate glucose pyrophosphatase-like isoform X1 [Drosophila arizonae]|uniref:Uridine diphosphate glucose pyrophosphatase-like isoform X1 n=1 Tax=Drosophila arizonae TaxID=7263 RepID=A0ABM1Q5T7_DROAR|nr:PREDICTED: uridine diphosphate glucose pyrophosphatase-like isoform X1 [Drosophila arizonae]
MLKSLAALGLRYSSNAKLPHGQQLSNVTKICFSPLPEVSKWLVPVQVQYIENGKTKMCDIFKVHDSVSIVLYNISRQKLIFVRQFRPAVYYGLIINNFRELPKEDIDLIQYPYELGMTLESCAGMVDKDKSLAEIAREEVFEECGYDVSVDRIEEVMNYRSGVGSSGAKQAMYYCEVTDADKVNSGGGVEDELIEVVELSLDEAKKMVQQGAINNSPPSCLMGLLWFFANKAPANA